MTIDIRLRIVAVLGTAVAAFAAEGAEGAAERFSYLPGICGLAVGLAGVAVAIITWRRLRSKERGEFRLARELEENVRRLDAHIRDEQSLNRCLEAVSRMEEFESAVHFFLRELGEKAGADRCCIFLFRREPAVFNNTYEWIREGLSSLREQLLELDLGRYGEFHELLEENREVAIPDTSRPQPGLEELAELASSLGIRSVLVSGIRREERLVGFAVLDFIRDCHEFSEADYRRIHNACNFYLLAFERERRLKEIRNSVMLQKQIFDNIMTPVVLFDLRHTIIAANPAACETSGRMEQELVGQKCYRALCGFAAPPAWCPMRRTVGERKTVRIEYEGHGREYIVTTQPVFDGDGKLIYVLETAHDISTQKQQARQLATRNLLLNQAADLARITYFSGNASTEVRMLGGGALAGLTAEDGRNRTLLEWVIPEDREELLRLYRQLENGECEVVETVCRSEAGGERRSYRLVVMRDRQSPGLYIGVLQDISASLEMENERQKLIRTLNNYVENERIINACLSQIVLEEDFDRNVDEILKVIATQLDSDRVYFGVFEELGQTYQFSHEWLNEGVASLKTIRDCRFYEQFLRWYDRFRNDELLVIADIRNSEYAEVLREPGCRTLICAPVLVNRKLYGILGVGFIRERRNVTALDENIMRSAARIIALSREHQLQREALDALDRQNRIVLDTMPIPVCLFDGEGKLLRGNPAVAALAGKSSEELLEKPCHETLCRSEAFADFCPVRNVLRSGNSCSCEINTNGHECLVTATPIRDRYGRITHVVESAIDLTEINEGKRKLEVAMHAAQAADRAKSYFLATMSHELRTPLNAVIGFSELLKSADLDGREREDALDAIHSAGTSLLELVNDVLDLSKLEAEKMDIIPEFLDLAEFLDGIGRIFIPAARSKNLTFRLELSPGLPGLVKFDRKRLRQVIVNILGNAFKFTRSGGVTLFADFTVAGPGRGNLRLAVRDTGPGMSPHEVRELFVPFKQHRSRDAEGTGLGLVISQRLVERMGGSIEVESEVGRGTVFSIHLKGMEFTKRGPEPVPGEEPKSVAPVCCSGRALLVDDVAMNLKILGAMLKRLGVEYVSADSGAAALEILKREQPGVILTDLWMPGMSGIELVEHLTEDPRWKQIPVIAVTADVQIAAEKRALFTDLLLKPITLDSLREVLGRTLRVYP